MNPNTTLLAEKKYIIETYFDCNNPEKEIKTISAYERLENGEKGKHIWTKHFRNGEIVEYDTTETMSWEKFCKMYKDCPKYVSPNSL